MFVPQVHGIQPGGRAASPVKPDLFREREKEKEKKM
jgi:hypothetical protein